jgi:hypothetical protein
MVLRKERTWHSTAIPEVIEERYLTEYKGWLYLRRQFIYRTCLRSGKKTKEFQSSLRAVSCLLSHRTSPSVLASQKWKLANEGLLPGNRHARSHAAHSLFRRYAVSN